MGDKKVSNINYLKPPTPQLPSLIETMKDIRKPVFNFKKLPKPPKQPTIKECGDKYIAEKLYNDWVKVMQEEAKNHISAFKPDPNISKKFFEDIVKTAERLNCKPEDLAAAMYRESHFDPTTKSSSGKYKGLIQMDEQALKDSVNYAVKTDNRQINPDIKYKEYAKLPREKQLKYAEAYLKFRIDEKGLTGKKLTGGQLYTLIRVPNSINNSKEVKKHQEYINKAKKVPSEIKKQG